MNSSSALSAAQTDIKATTHVDWMKIALFNFLAWTFVCFIGAAGNYNDLIQQKNARPFLAVFWSWERSHLLLIAFTSILYIFLKTKPGALSSFKKIAQLYVVLISTIFPLQLIFITLIAMVVKNIAFSPSKMVELFWTIDNFTLFIEFFWITGTFTIVVAICVWHLGQARAYALQQTLTANLNLHLALEQQKLRSLRQQLEPHFIFNALNAISALVRSNEKPIALKGIHRLSDLLRYALVSSTKDWVSFADEMRFIRDYIALQSLRYGERLQITITGEEPGLLQGDCPPLLLQPLIENALRHDLDCHEEKSDIHLNFALNGSQVSIKLRNNIVDKAASNPGLGLGLVQTKTRLELMYQGAASLQIKQGNDFFEVQITMPLHQPEPNDN